MADSTTVEYIAKLVDNVSAPLKRIESNAEQARRGIEGVGSVFGALAKFELTTMGFDAIQSSISKTIDLTKEYEDNLTRLEVILGDPKLAKSYTDQMQTIADSTNYTFTQLSGVYTKLAGSIEGLAPEQLKGGVLDFANATKGAESLDSLAEAIKDISNSERWKEFGIKSEKIGDNVALTFKKVRKVVAGDEASIFKAIQEFGQMEGVAGMTEKLGSSLSGQLSTLEDTWDGLFRRIGVANSKAFGNIAGALTSLLKSDAITNFVGTIASGISNTISFFQNLDFSKTLESIKPITDLLVGAGGLLTLIWRNLPKILEPFLAKLAPMFEMIKNTLNYFVEIWTKITGGFESWKTRLEGIITLFQNIFSVISFLTEKVYNFFKPVIQLITTIVGMVATALVFIFDNVLKLVNKISSALGGKEFKFDTKDIKIEVPKLPEATAEALAKGKEKQATEQKAKTSVTGETINTAKPQRIIVNIGSLINGYNQTINLKQATVEEAKNLANLVQSEVVKLLVSAVNDVASLE